MLAILVAATVASGVQGIEITPERAWKERGISNVTFKLTNNTDGKYQRVHVRCTFFDENGRAIDVAPSIVSNVAPRSSSYGKASIVIREPAKDVSCIAEFASP